MNKIGMVLEGGAMRGLFTAGVLDVMMEENIKVDGIVGVSAGACFGCNYKSHQIGRVLRYNKNYCSNPDYAGFRNWLKTGDVYGRKLCYHDIPDTLDPFDVETYQNSPMEFYAVATDVNTGDPVYHKCEEGMGVDLEWFRASAAMPLAARIVKIDGYSLLDGGVADSIPIRFFQEKGYNRNIIVLTQPQGYVKEQNKFLPVMKVTMGKYPNFIKAVERRHEMYNETLAYILELEREGKAVVIRPSKPLNIGAVERNPDKLQEVYDEGRRMGKEAMDKIKTFVKAANLGR